ncbi:MAG: glutamine synthetase [Hydrococcus sp. C42_A2020_068]|nr:glutamine synthetase [Hydrococcus sp. C42_A2020_068]
MERSILNLLDRANINFVRLLWCDNGNVIRGKAVHVKRLSEYFVRGVGISAAQQAIPVMYDAPAANSGLGPVGEVRLVPDWNTLTVLPYAPGHARAMGDLVKDGRPWSCCPRDFLKRAIAAAADERIEVRAAFENEFYLLRPAVEKIVPADTTVFASTLSMDLQQPVIDEIAAALIDQGLIVEQYYPESGPGQQEISVLYKDALTAADQQIVFRETVKAIARNRDLIASFLPKIFAEGAGSGCHLHLSLWRDGNNILPYGDKPGQLSPLASQFVAGLLAHLPALMAITTPSPNSYRRILPHSWSGAFRCWGFDNREAAIRVPTNPDPPSPTHIEYKTSDASANPYLALGAVIVTGLDGIRRGLELPEPVTVDPGNLSDSEREKRGISRLPSNLGVAIAHLQRDDLLLGALGDDLAKAFLAVRSCEWEEMKTWEFGKEVQLLLERY